MAKHLMPIGGLVNFFSFTRENIIFPSILNTKRAKHRDTQINTNRRTAHRDQRAQAQNALFSPLLTRACEKPPQIIAFLRPTSYAQARRTLGNAYLSMVSEGARSPARIAAAKKEPPSGTLERVGVIEHGRPRQTIRRCYASHLRSHQHSTQNRNLGPLSRQAPPHLL